MDPGSLYTDLPLCKKELALDLRGGGVESIPHVAASGKKPPVANSVKANIYGDKMRHFW